MSTTDTINALCDKVTKLRDHRQVLRAGCRAALRRIKDKTARDMLIFALAETEEKE